MRILALDLGAAWRGGQRQTLLLSLGLAARGHRVTVAARKGSPLAEVVAARSSLGLAPILAGSEATPGVLLGVARAARRSRADILYAGEARGHGAAVWSRAASARPLVVHRRVVFAPRRNSLSRVKYAAADRFLAVSQAVKDSLLAAGIPESRVAIVPDGLPPEAYVVSPCPTAPPLRLVHVGAFDGRKGQSLVIEVLSRLVERGWDLSAVFLGDGPSRGEVEKAARAAGVSARCEFAGVVNDVPERLASSHLLLLPSDSEGAPLALVEAMAAGCPVLAHDVGGTAEVVRQGVAGRLVSSLDPEVWTTEVIRLLGDPKLRAGFVEEGRRAAAERTIQRTVILLESHLNDVLAASQTAESARPK